MTARALGLAAASAFLLLAGQHARAGTDVYVGEIITFAGNYCPRGYLPLDGRVLKIIDNTTLFALIGTTYGGDGMTTFALPTGMPVFTATGAPLNQCIAAYGNFPPRD